MFRLARTRPAGGKRDRDHWTRDQTPRVKRAALRGGAAQIPKGAEASRVDPAAGPARSPHVRGKGVEIFSGKITRDGKLARCCCVSRLPPSSLALTKRLNSPQSTSWRSQLSKKSGGLLPIAAKFQPQG
jgi:hypothetical protein